VGIDNGCGVIFFGNFEQKIINYIRRIRIKTRLGSSQKRYFGLFTIALAIQHAAFLQISDGIFCWLYQDVLFLLLQTLFFFFLNVKFVNISSGNIIFSSVKESNRALP
jgi:hypothetical protein